MVSAGFSPPFQFNVRAARTSTAAISRPISRPMHATDILRLPVLTTQAREYLVLVPVLDEGNVMRLVVGVRPIKEKRWVSRATFALFTAPVVVLAER